jgi:hypothetical protein
LSGVFLIGLWGRRRAVLIAMGDDPKTLFCDTNKDRCYPIEYSALVILNTSPEDEGSSNSMVLREAVAEGADLIVTDLRQKGRVDYYARLFPRICFADYDSVFERYYGRKPRHGPGEG